MSDSPDAIDTGRFIDVYVELRMATLRAGVTQLPVAERDRILGQHGVSERDLLTFVEVYGRNAQFMHTVWDSIESLIDARRTGTADSTATPGTSGA